MQCLYHLWNAKGMRKMDYKETVDAISASIIGIADLWIFKVTVAFAISIITNTHTIAILIFSALIFVDLLTKWIAICYADLEDRNAENTDLYSCVMEIPTAMRVGSISSNVMKHRFAGKILAYMIMTLLAVLVDNMVFLAGEEQIFLKINWIYLAMTESISILENLREAGVDKAGQLLDFLKNKLGSYLK